jgi:hypothetical protein
MPGATAGSSYAAMVSFSGTMATPTGTGVFGYYVFPFKAGRIGGMAFRITTAGTTTANVVDVHLNGASIFGATADRPTGATGTAGAMTVAPPTTKGLKYEDVITVVGVTNGTGAANLVWSIALEKA